MLGRRAALGAGDACRSGVVVGAGDRLDGAGISVGIAPRIGVGPCAFAQHVERAERERALATAALQRLVDGATDHELAADDLHRAAQGLADDRLARPLGEPAQPSAGVAALQFPRQIHQSTGEHEAPGGCIDEQGAGATRMGAPIPCDELLGDQTVCGLIVGDAQQGLSQAHEGDALLVGEAELLQESIEVGAFIGARAGPLDELPGGGQRRIALDGRQGRQERGEVVGLRAQGG